MPFIAFLPSVWVKSVGTAFSRTTNANRCVRPADMIVGDLVFVRLSGDERPERKTRLVHEHFCCARTPGSELRSLYPPFTPTRKP